MRSRGGHPCWWQHDSRSKRDRGPRATRAGPARRGRGGGAQRADDAAAPSWRTLRRRIQRQRASQRDCRQRQRTTQTDLVFWGEGRREIARYGSGWRNGALHDSSDEEWQAGSSREDSQAVLPDTSTRRSRTPRPSKELHALRARGRSRTSTRGSAGVGAAARSRTPRRVLGRTGVGAAGRCARETMQASKRLEARHRRDLREMEARRAALDESIEAIEESLEVQQEQRRRVLQEMEVAHLNNDFDEVEVSALAVDALDDWMCNQTRRQMMVELHRDSVDTMIRYKQWVSEDGLQ
eukprot:4610078-Pyramimonas_sp.AAC.1